MYMFNPMFNIIIPHLKHTSRSNSFATRFGTKQWQNEGAGAHLTGIRQQKWTMHMSWGLYICVRSQWPYLGHGLVSELSHNATIIQLCSKIVLLCNRIIWLWQLYKCCVIHMSPNLTKSYRISPNLTIYHQISPNLITSYQISPYICT